MESEIRGWPGYRIRNPVVLTGQGFDSSSLRFGAVVERLMALAWKVRGGQPPAGSNPVGSAMDEYSNGQEDGLLNR